MREPGEELILARVRLLGLAVCLLQFSLLPSQEASGVRLIDGCIQRAVQALGVEPVLDEVVLHAGLHRLDRHRLAARAGEHHGGELLRAAEFFQILDEIQPRAVG